MADHIGLSSFIKQIKAELVNSSKGEKPGPTLLLNHVEVEANIAVSGGGKAGIDIGIVKLGGNVAGSQYHKVKLSFKPVVVLPEEQYRNLVPGGGGSGGGNGANLQDEDENTKDTQWEILRVPCIGKKTLTTLEVNNIAYMRILKESEKSPLLEGEVSQKVKEA